MAERKRNDHSNMLPMPWRGRGNRRAAALVGAMVSLGLLTGTAAAQCVGTACTVTISLPVSDVIRLDLSTSTTALGSPGQADFIAGWLVAPGDGPTAAVKANGPYTLSVTGNAPSFSYAGSFTNPNKPSSALTWAPGTGAAPGTCTGLATFGNSMGTAATLLSGSSGGPAIGVSAPSKKICYRTLWSFTSSPPGTYSLVVNFTLSGP